MSNKERIDENTSLISNVTTQVTNMQNVVNDLPIAKAEQTKFTDPATSVVTVTPDQGYTLSEVTVNAVTSTIDSNITPSNIANGVNILGVTGTLISGEDLNNELNAQNLVIANLENQIDELSDIINNAGIGGLTTLPNGITLAYSKCNEFPNFDMTEIVSGYLMFSECYNITTTPNYNFINLINASHMFKSCRNLINIPNYCLSNVDDAYRMFQGCSNLVDIPDFYAPNINNIAEFVGYSSNLSDASVQNIINMCINSNITQSWQKTLLTNTSQSPFYQTNITNDRYQNRWDDLDNAGWTY